MEYVIVMKIIKSNNMNSSDSHNGELNKLHTVKSVLFYSIYMKFTNRPT